MPRPIILFLVSEDWFFCSHRLAMARGARDAGWQVVVVCRVDRHAEAITREGFRLLPLDMKRGSANPFGAVGELRSIARIYRAERPDLVHHVAVKLSLIGTVAALLAGVPHVVNQITGLGYLFIADTRKARTLRRMALALLRPLLHARRVHTVVQNHDDLQLLRDQSLAPPARTALIRGSGVDHRRFVPGTPAEGPPQVILVGRMLADKGVGELVAAARLLRSRGETARIVLVGPSDPENPRSLPDSRLAAWDAEGAIEWWGQRRDVPAIWARATLAVLPSYREGLPKSLLEAGSCGLALIATDVPGCRELVRHEVDGLLVPVRDAQALADAIQRLLRAPALREAYGRNARDRIVTEFSEDVIVAQTTALYERIIGHPPGTDGT